MGATRGTGTSRRGPPDALIGASAKVLGSASLGCGLGGGLGGLRLVGMVISRSPVSNKAWMSKWSDDEQRKLLSREVWYQNIQKKEGRCRQDDVSSKSKSYRTSALV
jgi:hypothetical protein